MRTQLLALYFAAAAAAAPVVPPPGAGPRELYGAERLRAALASAAVQVPAGAQVLLERRADGQPESFRLERRGSQWIVSGADASGVLYGCLELERSIRRTGVLPQVLPVSESPAFRIRGTNLFWMKWGSRGYDWPVTPEHFPWFFDRSVMLRYLDQLVENRYNTIYFWNGHPFPYFLELARYPEARMLSPEELKRNIEHFRWFTSEADRRGIWTVFHFYNIHVPPSFAKAHEREGVRLANSANTPLLQAYMRYAVGEFVKSYPSVGLMLTAGEALVADKEQFIRDTIIPGIRDSGRQPPLIVRQWTINPDRYRELVKPEYPNLFTMMKHNTEMIVSPHPDPRNQTWIAFGQNHIVNVHENSDIKPFRWASPVFIQQMVRIWKEMGVRGYHLYPLVSWHWPRSLDSAPLSAIDRDRDWIEAFGRYGWNPDRPAAEEEKYWVNLLAGRFGAPEAGRAVYDYYVKAGPVLPGLQNLVNVYNMNFHPTAISREATLNGILHSARWEGLEDNLGRPLDDLTLELYQKRHGALSAAARGRPPLTVSEAVSGGARDAVRPVELAALFADMAQEALTALEKGEARATRERDEYGRFLNDARAVAHLARFYREKVAAALEKGLFDRTGETAYYDRMLARLAASVKEYAALDRLATPAYRQATDLGEWFRWDEMTRCFTEELAFYRRQAALAGTGAELVCLGLDGPMSDATHAFHWTLELQREKAGWSSQSYRFGADPLGRARLVVVYDLASPDYRKMRPRLDAWVRGGGKLVIWDPLARASGDGFLDGITFWANASYPGAASFAFTRTAHPLTQGLPGTVAALPREQPALSSIRSLSGAWQILAYAVLNNAGGRQFGSGHGTFGPRWTSILDKAYAPLLVTRRHGSGEVLLAQLGLWAVQPQANMNSNRIEAAPPHLRRLAENLLGWSAR